MANTQAPFGFSQYNSNGGSGPNYQMTTRQAQYNAGAIYAGDPVTSLSDGTIAQAVAGTAAIAGIFYGCEYLSVSQKRLVWNNYWPGSDVASGQYVTCYLVTDPNAQFLCQAGGSTTPIGLADVGNLINFAIGTGNASNGLSGAYADQTTLSPSTTTRPFKIMSLVTNPPGANGSDSTSAYNFIVVGFNNVDSRILTGI